MTIKPEGQAQVGEYLRTPWGQVLQIVAIQSGRHVVTVDGVYWKHSIAGNCFDRGKLSGKHCHDQLRAEKKRLNRLYRKLQAGERYAA